MSWKQHKHWKHFLTGNFTANIINSLQKDVAYLMKKAERMEELEEEVKQIRDVQLEHTSKQIAMEKNMKMRNER